MSWKDQLIRSKKEADAFLKRELKTLGIAAEVIWDIGRWSNGITSLEVKVIDRDEKIIFQAKADVYSHTIIIKNFDIGPEWHFAPSDCPYKGKNISFIGLKALIGAANQYTEPVSNIQLKGVEMDGPRFWSYLGGFPVSSLHGYVIIGDIRGLLSRELAQYEGDRRGQLENILEMAKEYPVLAYRALSQIKRTGDYSFDRICNTVIKRLCRSHHDEPMAIDLADASTFRIMRQRLGILPVCPIPIHPGGHFSDVAYEVARRDGDEGFFRDQLQYQEVRRKHILMHG